MTAARLPSFPRPIMRRRELGLLLAVSAALLLGSLSLGFTRTGHPVLAHPAGILVYLGTLAGVHIALVVAGRRLDEVLLPAVGMLGGIGLLLAERLPQDLVVQQIGSTVLGLASLQLIWLVPPSSRSRCARTAGFDSTSTPGRPLASACLHSRSSSGRT